MRHPSRPDLPLFLITVLGIALRLVNFGFEPLKDMDEAWSLAIARMPVGQIVSYSILQDFNPPMYYLAAHLAMLVGGVNILMARLPSLVAGVALIPISYLIGKEMEGRTHGLVLAGYTATFFSVIYYADYARAFAMVGAIFAVTIWAFIRILKGKGEWIVFAISGLAAIYTHSFAIVPLGFMILYLIYLRNINWRALASMIVAGIPFGIMMYQTATTRQAVGYVPMWVSWATPQGVAIAIPLELFGYAAPLIIGLAVWTVWKSYSRCDWPLVGIGTLTCAALVAFSPVQLVYAHYALLVMPMFAAVALVPVTRWIQERNQIALYLAVVYLAMQYTQLAAWLG
jgi:uncharacterized membrane protein